MKTTTDDFRRLALLALTAGSIAIAATARGETEAEIQIPTRIPEDRIPAQIPEDRIYIVNALSVDIEFDVSVRGGWERARLGPREGARISVDGNRSLIRFFDPNDLVTYDVADTHRYFFDFDTESQRIMLREM